MTDGFIDRLNVTSRWKILLGSLILVLYIIGLILHIFYIDLARKPFLAELFLFVTNSIVLYIVLLQNRRSSLIIWSLIILLTTFIIEATGVASGVIFGEYFYGEGMQIKLINVPLIIAYNWLILILGSFSIASLLIRRRFLIPFVSALIIVLFDFILEPVAVKLDYWQWANSVIPVQNYIVWGLITLIFSFMLYKKKFYLNSEILRLLFITQFLFFLSLRLLMP